MKLVACFLLFLSVAQAEDLRKLYTVGSGSKFDLSVDGLKTELMIYVTEVAEKQVGIETYMSAKSMGIPLELWQQTRLAHLSSGITIKDAFLYSDDLKKAEKIPVERIKGQGDMELRDFLLVDKTAMAKFKVGDETVETPAGKVKTTHYQKAKGKDVIDFWVSDEAKPIGLVKLNSTGKQKFNLVLTSLVKNVPRKIDPDKAGPLTDKGSSLLGLAGNAGVLP